MEALTTFRTRRKRTTQEFNALGPKGLIQRSHQMIKFEGKVQITLDLSLVVSIIGLVLVLLA